MEKLTINRSSTQAKMVGTITSMAGAMVVVLYKGPTILSDASPTPTQPMSLHWPLHFVNSQWLIGGLLLATEYILYSFWLILQVHLYAIELSNKCKIITIIIDLCKNMTHHYSTCCRLRSWWYAQLRYWWPFTTYCVWPLYQHQYVLWQKRIWMLGD